MFDQNDGRPKKLNEQMNSLQKNIVLVHPSVIRPCGPDNSLFELVKRLDQSKYKLYLIVPRHTIRVKKFEPYVQDVCIIPEAVPVAAPTTPRKAINFLTTQYKAVKNIRAYLTQHQIDLVHTNMESCWVTGIAARSLGIPSVAHIRGLAGINSKIRAILTPFFMKVANNRFIAVSKSVAEAYEQNHISSSKIYVVTNGIDVNQYSPQNKADYLRQQFQLSAETPLIGAVGSADPRKGWVYLVLACSLLVQQFPDLNCFFIGDFGENGSGQEKFYGEYTYVEIIRALVSALKLDKSVHFLGPKEDVTNIYASLDIVIQPSLTEAGSRTVLEALSTGCPVVATNVGGNRNYVRHLVDGVLVPPCDAYALKTTIANLLSDNRTRKAMGEQARSVAVNYYSIETHVESISKIYQEMIKF